MPVLKNTKKRSIVMHALTKYCDKQADRTQLKGGDKFDVDLQISGTIGKQKVEEICRGCLTVGHDQTKNTSYGIEPAKVIAWLLSVDPQKEKHLEQLRKMAESKSLGDAITADQEEQACLLLKQFNQAGDPKVSKGSVSFSPARAAA